MHCIFYSFNVTNGVRQGVILSPQLFKVYINGLSDILNSHTIGGVVAMSSSQCVNRGRACIVVNRDNYSEYYMCVQWPSTFFAKSLFFAHFKIYAVYSSNYGQVYLTY